jgi:hypothetical protein
LDQKFNFLMVVWLTDGAFCGVASNKGNDRQEGRTGLGSWGGGHGKLGSHKIED